MANYLLLRNNKQQGPLSLQHLIQLGLKPYDLVWVEGKSAAWRYPSEIAELKPYSIVVEEQPFDRFYKKPGIQKEENQLKVIREIVTIQPSIEKSNYERIETPVIHMSYEKRNQDTDESRFMPKSVNTLTNSDILPQKEVNSTGIVFPEENKPAGSFRTKSVYVTMPVQTTSIVNEEPVFNFHPSPVTDACEEPMELETKSSRPLEDIKEMYVQKLAERKKQAVQKNNFNALLKKTAIAACIITIGVLIGFVIKPSNKKYAVQGNYIVQQPVTSPETIPQQQIETTDPSKNEILAPVEKQYPEPSPERKVDKPVSEKEYSAKTSSPAVVMKPIKHKQILEAENPGTFVVEPAPSVEVNAATGERIKKSRETNKVEPTTNYPEKEEVGGNKLSKDGITNLVSVKTNSYHVVAIGGIRNLQLTVLNDSKYILDNVVVEVKYLKPTNQELKTETVEFKSVSPNGSLTIRVPDTNRGMKVVYKVVKVESKEFTNEMAGL